MYSRAIPLPTPGPPPESPPRRAPGVTVMGVTLFLAVALLLGFLLYFAQFSGTVRWLLGVAFLAVLAALAWDQIVKRTAQPVPLVGPTPPGVVRDGELESLAAAVRRASDGLTYSQVLVASRARNAFVERARLALGLSPEAMRDLQKDPEALERLVGDRVLAEFVHMRTQDLDDRYRWVLRARDRGRFASQFRDVLARMEVWR